MLSIKINQRDLDRAIRFLGEKRTVKIVRKAGSDAIRAVRVGASRNIRSKKRFKVARVNRSLVLAFPKGSKLENLSWSMAVNGQPVPVADFPNRQTRKGVSVAINTGKRTLIKGAFKATMKSGHQGIFVRRGEKRFPIKEAYTTKVSDVFFDSDMFPDLAEKAQKAFETTFARLFSSEK